MGQPRNLTPINENHQAVALCQQLLDWGYTPSQVRAAMWRLVEKESGRPLPSILREGSTSRPDAQAGEDTANVARLEEWLKEHPNHEMTWMSSDRRFVAYNKWTNRVIASEESLVALGAQLAARPAPSTRDTAQGD